jgi:hypothetical protein
MKVTVMMRTCYYFAIWNNLNKFRPRHFYFIFLNFGWMIKHGPVSLYRPLWSYNGHRCVYKVQHPTLKKKSIRRHPPNPLFSAYSFFPNNADVNQVHPRVAHLWNFDAHKWVRRHSTILYTYKHDPADNISAMRLGVFVFFFRLLFCPHTEAITRGAPGWCCSL